MKIAFSTLNGVIDGHTYLEIDGELTQQEIRTIDAILRIFPSTVRDHTITFDNFDTYIDKHVLAVVNEDDEKKQYEHLTRIAAMCMRMMCVFDTMIKRKENARG